MAVRNRVGFKRRAERRIKTNKQWMAGRPGSRAETKRKPTDAEIKKAKRKQTQASRRKNR